MEFTKISKEEYEGLQFRNYKIKDFLERFLDANIEYARVQWAGEYKNEAICSQTLKDVIKKYGLPVMVKTKSHSVYLINTRYNG